MGLKDRIEVQNNIIEIKGFGVNEGRKFKQKLLKVTKNHIICESLSVPGSTTRYRRSDGYQTGGGSAYSGWRIASRSMDALHEVFGNNCPEES